jgi:uncharacterized membrane protein
VVLMFRALVGKLRSCLAGVSRTAQVAIVALTVTGSALVSTGVASATEYKVEYKTLTDAAEANFGEAITAVLVILGIIIGVMLGIRMVKRLLK